MTGIVLLLVPSAVGAYFVYGGVVTGIFLKKDYMPYAAVYRPADQIMKNLPFGIATTFSRDCRAPNRLRRSSSRMLAPARAAISGP